jgi:zinc protease
MIASRFESPLPAAPTPVRFPPIERTTLANGLSVWTIPHGAVPVVTVVLVLPRGTADDPADRPGLVSLTGDLLDEGAGDRDAIALADAFARLGAQLEIDVGPDATTIAVSALARDLDACLSLVADIAQRPRMTPADVRRVRDLRISRLRQLSQTPGTVADRAFVAGIFGDHPYGHGALGTTASLQALADDEPRAFWEHQYGPEGATIVVAGAVTPAEVTAGTHRTFGDWRANMRPRTWDERVALKSDPRIVLVDRPSAPQSELRIGHVGTPRRTSSYHALVTLNAVLGGQFTSRINRALREEQAVTYGARSSFDFRRVSGGFCCETSVQADATARAVADVLGQFEAIREDGNLGEAELDRAKASLTRGYVRNFETAAQLARAAAQLVTFGLDDDVFDRFVPQVEAVTVPVAAETARAFVRPADTTVVVVGDAATVRGPLESLGHRIVQADPEF